MALQFITGASGSGKTTVTKELLSRGFNAYDTDDQERTHMAGWHDLATGEYVAGYNERDSTEDFLKTHMWKLTNEALEDFGSRAETEHIYLCGRLRDATPVINMSQHLVFLTVSAATIEERLAKRALIPDEVEWGRIPWQVIKSIAVNREIESEYRNLGAIMINADQPLPKVVDDILKATT